MRSVSASVTAALSAGTLDQSVAVSSVSHSAPADSSESRRYGAPNRPRSQARAGPSPSDVPPRAASSALVSACRLSTCSLVPSNTVMPRQPPVIWFSPIASVVARLTPVSASSESRMTVGPVAFWVTARRAAAPVAKSGNDHASYRTASGAAVHAQPHLGDDAEGALRTDQQLAQVGARGRFRCAAQIHRAHRRDHAQPAHHVVEPAVAGRVLAGRSGRRKAADGGVLEALREMPEREAVFAEQAFGVRSGDAGPENGLRRTPRRGISAGRSGADRAKRRRRTVRGWG